MNVLIRNQILKYTRLATLLTFSTVASASNVYKWTDDNGQVHFGQNPSTSFNSELIYPQKRSYSIDDSNKANNEVITTNSEGDDNIVEDAQETAAENVFKKDSSLCKQAQESKRILMQHPIIRRQGKVLSMEEKNEELKNLNDIISIHC